MKYIELKEITNYYGATKVLDHVDLCIQQGEFHTILGPSGCGKTTMLRLIGGFIQPADGSIFLDGIDITNRAPEKRNMGIVFQNYALFPNMSVAENVAYGLKLQKADKAKINEVSQFYLNLVGLWDFRDRKIQALSGGQQQRVAIARALAANPKVLLLDEPMSNLDVSLRIKMRQEIRQIQQKVGITTLFITHDQQEALAISDTISVMNNGQIEQTGSPKEVYETPKTDFVAAFVGKANVIDGTAAGAWGISCADGKSLYVRPEQIKLHKLRQASSALCGAVIGVQYQGAVIEYEISTEVGSYTALMLNVGQQGEPIAIGDSVYLELCL